VIEAGKEKKTKEELVSDLMFPVKLLILERFYSDNKRLAVERYMRTFLGALTTGELKAYLNLLKSRNIMQADIVNKINQASKGYDNYVKPKRKRFYRRYQT